MSGVQTCALPILQNVANISQITDRAKCCKNFAKKHNLICVLKGEKTLISDGVEIYEDTTGTNAMSTAGSGDVLTGIIAGFLAQDKTNKPINLTKVAVFIHGTAGELAEKKYGKRASIASDFINSLKEIKNTIPNF